MPTFQQFPLPDAGEGLTEAEIVAWHVAVGDTVEVNQTIVEIETAKSLVDLPSPWAGVVDAAPRRARPDRRRRDADHRGRHRPGRARRRPTRSRPPSPRRPRSRPAARSSTATAAEGTGTRAWSPAGSDEIAAARADRAAEPQPEPAAREAVLVGYGLAEPATGRRGRTADGSPAAAPRTAPSPRRRHRAAHAVGLAATSSQREATRHALAKPPVRKLARELGVDLDSISPTGPGGIVTREDVLGRAAQAEARTLATYPGDDAPWLASGTVSSDGRQTRVPVKSVRKRTAEAMVTSAFTAPHVTVFHTVDVTKTMKLVERLRADREFADVRVTPLLIAAKALHARRAPAPGDQRRAGTRRRRRSSTSTTSTSGSRRRPRAGSSCRTSRTRTA